MKDYTVCNVGLINSKLVSFEVKVEAEFKTRRGSSDSDKSVVELYFKLMSRGFWDCTIYFPEVTTRSVSSISVVVRESSSFESRDKLVESLVRKACKRACVEAKAMASRASSIACMFGGVDGD